MGFWWCFGVVVWGWVGVVGLWLWGMVGRVVFLSSGFGLFWGGGWVELWLFGCGFCDSFVAGLLHVVLCLVVLWLVVWVRLVAGRSNVAVESV